MHVIDWLLQDHAPGVQYQTRLRLLDESPRSRRMTALRHTCNEHPPVSRMLERVDEAIAAGDYAKYKGAYWTLIFLAELSADGRDPRIRKLAKHVIATQLANGGFTAHGGPRYELVCLTANILRSLVHFGYGSDHGVVRGYHRLAERILPHGGVPCTVLSSCLHNSCKMTLPQTLRCLASAPKEVPRKKIKQMQDVLVKQMLDIRIFQYFRPDVKAFRQAVTNRKKGVKEREVRDRWIEKHTFQDNQLLPKPSWKRFGFPRSYNPDLLEAMLSLVELKVKYNPAMDDALHHIETKRKPDGRWILDDSLNGTMLANVERKGQSSKWITLRAMTVLKHFGRSIS